MDAFFFTQNFEYSWLFTQNLGVTVDAFFTQKFELKLRKCENGPLFVMKRHTCVSISSFRAYQHKDYTMTN